jgi:hypothetical protein
VEAIQLPEVLYPFATGGTLNLRERYEDLAFASLQRDAIVVHDRPKRLRGFEAKERRGLGHGDKAGVGKLGQRPVDGLEYTAYIAQLGQTPRFAQLIA